MEADLGHAHTPYYVVQNLVTNLLELDTCRTAPEREHALMQHITDLKLRERMFLLNDLLGTHVRKFFFLHPFIIVTYQEMWIKFEDNSYCLVLQILP